MLLSSTLTPLITPSKLHVPNLPAPRYVYVDCILWQLTALSWVCLSTTTACHLHFPPTCQQESCSMSASDRLEGHQSLKLFIKQNFTKFASPTIMPMYLHTLHL